MLPERIRLASGDMVAEIGPQGGVVLGLFRGALPLLRCTPPGQERDPLAAACFPMVPFGGRVRDNAFHCNGVRYRLQPNCADPLYLHGDGWLSAWDVAAQDEAAVTLSLRHRADGTPYSYTATQRFTLHADSLAVMMSVRNDGDAALPFGLGLHPYCPWPPATTLRAAANRFWPEADFYLPGAPGQVPPALDFSEPRAVPRAWTNAAFGGWDGRAEIGPPGGRLTIEAAPAFAYYQLFVSDPKRDPAYAYETFCFEPMTHVPDSHDRPNRGGLALLAPGQSLQAGVRFRATETRH